MWRWPSGAPDSHVNDCWVGATGFLKMGTTPDYARRQRSHLECLGLPDRKVCKPSGDVALPVHALQIRSAKRGGSAASKLNSFLLFVNLSNAVSHQLEFVHRFHRILCVSALSLLWGVLRRRWMWRMQRLAAGLRSPQAFSFFGSHYFSDSAS